MADTRLNEYRITLPNRFTAGLPNTQVPEECRAQAYYIRRENQEAAQNDASIMFAEDVTVTLHRENVSPVVFKNSPNRAKEVKQYETSKELSCVSAG